MQNQQNDVELLDKLLQQQKTIIPRFRMWVDNMYLSYDDVVRALTTAVKVEIEMRHCTPRLDDYMTYIYQVAEFFTNPGNKFGLALMGTTGNGKTTMARAIKSVMNTLAKINNDRNKSVAFVEMVTAKQLVRSYRSDSKSWESLCKRHYLIIDDFGEEPVEVMDYGNVINPVIDLLSQRYDDQHLTILTTNVTNKQIRKTYGDRIADRFNEIMKVIIFTNPSYRS